MFQKSAKEILAASRQTIVLEEKYRRLKNPFEAIQLLQQTLNIVRRLDKHHRDELIHNLKQIATDLQFRYYRARCQFILIPPDDALTFWICKSLGQCQDILRFAFFEEKIRELIKLLSNAVLNSDQDKRRHYLPQREVTLALELFNHKFPHFTENLVREPVLIPILNFKILNTVQLSWPEQHSFALLAPKKGEEDYLLLTVLQALAHIVHYKLTGDLTVLPLGFENLMKTLSVEFTGTASRDAETFAEICAASLLYNTDYMSLAAYMEFGQNDQREIDHYFNWLQKMYSGIGDNVKKMMEEHQRAIQVLP